MSKKQDVRETYYESIRKQGYSRRDFMKFSAFIAAYMGLESTMIGQVAKALETTHRLPVIWDHFQECTCCSESFIRSDHPIVSEIILDKISLDYTQTLMAASGHQAEAAKHDTMKKYKGEYILCVEGSVPIGEVMAGIIVHVVTFGRLPELDRLGRPKAFYAKRVHDSCYRRPYYDAGLFAETFDDQNAKDGYCLYKLGCKGPTTYNSCGTIKWNNGVSYPIQSGHGCIGCSEEGFWDAGAFYERGTNIPGIEQEGVADDFGKVAAGVIAGGIAVHATAAVISKRKEVSSRIKRSKSNEKNIDS